MIVQTTHNQKRLLFVGAHPDDESFGPGGTLTSYAHQGVQVMYACATQGEVGSATPKYLKGFDTPGAMRWAELECAACQLGLARITHLGYRDSGMPGSVHSSHPDALVQIPVEKVAARVEEVILDFQPQVVVTFDPIGGYRHPDHIAIHHATTQAFFSARNRHHTAYSETITQPEKLYYEVFPRRFLKFVTRIMPIVGLDPQHFGRNKDIDLTSIAQVDFPVDASVRIWRQARIRKARAIECHASQLDNGPISKIEQWLRFIFGRNELYMRAFPTAGIHSIESDLFEGIQFL